ncbi:cytochrome c oxidase subunit II [bacterium]|nr:MAG: cytochrome c oxidase subunit II [bacterium]
MFNFPMAPPSASNFAREHDFVFYLLTILTLIFTLIVGVAVVFFTVRYRRGTRVDRSRPIYEDLRLELTWTIIPLILGLVMFFLGARLFVKMKTPPADAQEIFVIGKQWMWHAQHSNGVRENNTLHVPVGKPIKLTMISQDVLHAFYIPAFRVQMGVVPGRYTQMWFTPTEAGTYHLFCNMYCGTQHSEMGGTVVAMEPREFSAWLANGGNNVPAMTLEQSGAKLYNQLACNTCHGAEDDLRGPSLYSIYNKPRALADGSTRVADETYLRESILRPHNVLTQGYGPTMPSYGDKGSDGKTPQLSEEDVLKLVTYIRTMGTAEQIPAVNSTSMKAVPNAQTRTNNTTPLAVNAIAAQTPSPDATPTARKGAPSVNAIAAQEGRTTGGYNP